MTRLVFIPAFLFSLAASAQSARAGEAGLENGVDILQWNQIQHPSISTGERVLQYQRFIVHYSSSPLAEVAWTRLRDLRQTQGDWRRSLKVRRTIARIERSRRLHQRALEKSENHVIGSTLAEAEQHPTNATVPLAAAPSAPLPSATGTAPRRVRANKRKKQ